MFLHRPDAAATALAAVADRVEAVHHRVFEPSRMDVAALVLLVQQIQSLQLRETAALPRVVNQNEVHPRLTGTQTDMEWPASGGRGALTFRNGR